MSAWQLIQNPPREKFVLVFGPEGIDIAEYREWSNAWYRRNPTDGERPVKTPTHWMPLPEPPEAA